MAVMANEQRLLSIGEFAAMTHLTVKVLRRYHDSGLLTPARVDPWSGYRYYDADQIGAAQTIRRLRDLNMPVGEIAVVLADDDPAHRHQVLSAHLARMEQQLHRTGEAVAALRRLLTDPATGAQPQVQRYTTSPLAVAAITATVLLDDVLDWYGAAMDELDATFDAEGLSPSGPPGALYDNALFTEEHGNLTVYLPVDIPPAAGRVHPLLVAATDLAVTAHHGPHTDIDVTYGQLARWVLDAGLAIAGPVHETYCVGPRHTPDPAQWRTDIGWPVQPHTIELGKHLG